jgi:hypothetical protein
MLQSQPLLLAGQRFQVACLDILADVLPENCDVDVLGEAGDQSVRLGQRRATFEEQARFIGGPAIEEQIQRPTYPEIQQEMRTPPYPDFPRDHSRSCQDTWFHELRDTLVP